MDEFILDQSLYYVTESVQNYTEAKLTCRQNFSEIANLNGLNFEKFSQKIQRVENLKTDNILRVRSISTDFNKCFGTLDLSWINVDEGLAGNVRDICQGHGQFDNGMFYTLCSKPTESLNSNSLTDSSSDSGNPLVAIVVTLVSLLIVGTFIVLFFYFKKKRRTKLNQKSSVSQIELNESSNGVSNNYL